MGEYKQLIGATAWCLGLVGNTSHFGDGSRGSEFSSQLQVLSRIGIHVKPPGQALGLALVAATPVLVSCVVDHTSVVKGPGHNWLTSTGHYADKLFLQQGRPEEILMHVPSRPTQRRSIKSVTEVVHLQSPVRVLVKHSPRSCLLPLRDVVVLSCAKVIADPKSLLIHYLGLGYVSEVSSTTYTLRVGGNSSDTPDGASFLIK